LQFAAMNLLRALAYCGMAAIIVDKVGGIEATGFEFDIRGCRSLI
jgi:hypothetical protein